MRRFIYLLLLFTLSAHAEVNPFIKATSCLIAYQYNETGTSDVPSEGYKQAFSKYQELALSQNQIALITLPIQGANFYLHVQDEVISQYPNVPHRQLKNIVQNIVCN